MWEIIFGPDRDEQEMSFVHLGPRVYDIDVVEGIAALIQEDLDERDAMMRDRWARMPNRDPLDDDPLPSVLDPVRVLVTAPSFAGSQPGGTQSGVFQREVPLDQVRGLSASERSRVRVTGSSVSVSMAQAGPLRILGSGDLRQKVEHYLRSEGHRRFPVARLLAATPVLAAVALVVLWILMIATGEARGLTVAFGSIVTAGAAVGAVVVTRHVLRKVSRSDNWQGPRFREGSREEFRAAVLNIRAGVLTTAGGAVLGAVLLVVVQQMFGIDLS